MLYGFNLKAIFVIQFETKVRQGSFVRFLPPFLLFNNTDGCVPVK